METTKNADPRREIGQHSEDLAAEFLTRAGLKVLERNFRARWGGELDILAMDEDTLVVVEVRSTTTRYLKTPAVSVNREKRSHIVRATEAWLAQRPFRRLNVRFDVVAVVYTGGRAAIEWIRNAFRPESTANQSRFR